MKIILASKVVDFLPLLAFSLTNVVLGAGYDVVNQVTSRLSARETAIYTCSFENEWSAARHPNLYPNAAAHWSSPVIASHNSTYSMWKQGQNASIAVEQVAEVRFHNSIVQVNF